MTELHFKGKEFVYNHHLAVPHRPLVPDADKSVGTPDLAGNLIIQGDNLHALKALLPIYAGKVDCIFIDPPYNTGNEGWRYNDRVNAPMIKEWMDENPVGVEDGLRHDKWCAMMWPRLKLLHELLAEDGIMIVHIDDNELHHLCSLMNDVFGQENFVATVSVVSNLKGNQDQFAFAGCHEYVVLFAKDKSLCSVAEFRLDDDESKKWFEDEYGPYKIGARLKATGVNAPKKKRENLFFPIYVSELDEICLTLPEDNKSWKGIFPITDGQEMSWRWEKKKFENETHNVIVTRDEKGISLKKKQRPFDGENPSKKAKSVFYKPEYSTSSAASELKEIFGSKIFDTPKPLQLINDFVEICGKKNALILDSFAGSGTTAHAVLQANKIDDGNRKFILVEMEDDIADAVTAERIRRVIKGYKFTGKKKTELYREKLTFNKLKKGDISSTNLVEIIERYAEPFDRIQGEINNGDVVISGADDVENQTKGLGGSFTYCTLGEAIDLGRILSGNTLPAYADLAPVLFHMATNETLNPANINSDDFYIGSSLHDYVWMLYRPDLDWLKSDDAALTLSKAKEIFNTDPAKRHLVFAPARFVSEKVLKEENINVAFVPFPDSLYQVVREG